MTRVIHVITRFDKGISANEGMGETMACGVEAMVGKIDRLYRSLNGGPHEAGPKGGIGRWN